MARNPQHLPAVLAYLTEHGETQMKDLASAIDVSPATLYSAVASALVRGEIVKRSEGRNVFYRLPDQPSMERQPAPPATVAPIGNFDARAWLDGDVDLYGLVELEDGGYRLTAPMASRLRRLLGAA